MKHLMVIFAVMISFRAFSPVSSLQCNVCVSSVSWGDCESAHNSQQLTCEPEDSHCYRHMVHVDFGMYNMTGFAKGCATSDKCTPEALDRCNNGSGNQPVMGATVKCLMECCQGDLCI